MSSTFSSSNFPRRPIGCLVSIPFGSKTGFAIAPLEKLFLEIGAIITGSLSSVHFSYSSLDEGVPSALPENFANVITFDPKDLDPSRLRKVAEYVAQKNIDLVIFLDMQPSHPILKYLRKAGVKTAISYWGAPISSIMPWWKLLIKRALLRLDRHKLNLLIFESHAMAKFAILGRGVSARSVEIVPLGIDTTIFHPKKNGYLQTSLKIPSDKKVIFYSGHMEHRKGVAVLINAAVTLLTERNRKDLFFLICGNRPGEETVFRSLYEGRGIDESISFAGYRNDIPDIIPECLCGVIPSIGWDSFPRTALEIQASGIPIIGSRLDGIPETMVDGETGYLFEPGNSSALADIISKLADDESLTKKLGGNARRRIESELSITAQRNRLLQVVSEIVAKSH